MRGNLPAEVSSLIGRSAEVRKARELLKHSRLVSLTGVGGVGKTRLARAVAFDMARSFKDGVWLIDLTTYTDAALIERSLRDLLPGPETAPTLSSQVSGLSILVVLDNCEHVADAVGSLLAGWLPQCPATRVLTTTRTTLRVRGEQVFEVPPLSLPAENAPSLESSAVELFRERVTALNVYTSIDWASADVVELCRKLEGLPLAIELAALRTTVLSVEEIVEGLDSRFDLLAGGHADLPAHHRSLRALLHWSWELCSADEKRLWARFSSFGGSATLRDLATVCGLDPREAVDLVDSLVRNSVLQRHDAAGFPRFRMLDTIREFGMLMLTSMSEDVTTVGANTLVALRARHSAHYLHLVADASARWFGPEQRTITTTVAVEMENIRRALETAIADVSSYDSAATAVADLWFYWIGSGLLDEGRFWADRVVERFERIGRSAPHRLLWLRGWIHLVTGDVAAAQRDLIASLTAATLRLDFRNAAYARAFLGALHGFSGDRLLFESEYRVAVATARALGDDFGAAMFLVHQAEIFSLTGQVEEAERLCIESAALCEAHGDVWCTGYMLWVKSLCSYVREDYPQAAEFAREAAALLVAVNDHLGAVLASEVAAWVYGADDPVRAMTVLTATGRFWQISGKTLLGFNQLMGQRDTSLVAISASLSMAEVARATAAGREIGEGGARSVVEFAFGTGIRAAKSAPDLEIVPSEASSTQDALGVLSAREKEIAVLVGQGLTNQQIADSLIIGRRTVDTHVSNILAKCGLRRRTEIAALVARRSVA
ncbi:ATP-binding protein [Rhodococcus pyridinivorans]|uniref:ATP-binding protein n=1 Tax=Rhodococcus pyridinivorans TaxID=103816 RepID=UPI00068803B2|nr:LuxR family transcriptional regulator [Rhodococcus pyridinivorans]